MTATAKAVCKSNPSRVNNPAKLPSVTPNPPGDIESEPKITDIGYMLSKSKNPTKCIPSAPTMKKIPMHSIKRQAIVNPEHEHIVLASDECLMILCDSEFLMLCQNPSWNKINKKLQ